MVSRGAGDCPPRQIFTLLELWQTSFLRIYVTSFSVQFSRNSFTQFCQSKKTKQQIIDQCRIGCVTKNHSVLKTNTVIKPLPLCMATLRNGDTLECERPTIKWFTIFPWKNTFSLGGNSDYFIDNSVMFQKLVSPLFMTLTIMTLFKVDNHSKNYRKICPWSAAKKCHLFSKDK